MKRFLLTVAVAVPLAVLGAVGVWQLSGDEPRRQGALTAASTEPISLVWRGAWAMDAKYAPGEVVSYEKSSYVAEEGTAGAKPGCARTDERCPWALMADGGAQGLKGDPGVKGEKGETGAKGEPGSAGPATDSIMGRTTVPACTTQNQSGFHCRFLASPEGQSVAKSSSYPFAQSSAAPSDFVQLAQNHFFVVPAVAASASALAVTASSAPGQGTLAVYLMVLAAAADAFAGNLACSMQNAQTSCVGPGPLAVAPGSRIAMYIETPPGHPGGPLTFGWRLG